jgi:bifunctional enzyme CysN/CysC
MSDHPMDKQADIEHSPLKLVVVGHVDDGKSTLIGRLLYETGSFPEGKFEEIKEVSLKRNMPIEWSFVLDAFQVERDQAITIDTTQILLNTSKRNIVIIDAPGHIEFLKSMISGTADADAAFLLIDGSQGIQQQTRRHAYLLNFLGIQQIVVIINKMDLMDFSESVFHELSVEIHQYFRELGTTPKFIIPVSAKQGDMLIAHSKKMSWYEGPTILEAFDALAYPELVEEQPLRFPIQDVYKFDERRILVGRLESGSLKVGDELLISSSHQTARVQSIENWNGPEKQQAKAGESIGITLNKKLFVERGDILSHLEKSPILTNLFYAKLFWVGDQSLEEGKSYKLKLYTRETRCIVQAIQYRANTDTLEKSKANKLQKNECGEVMLQVRDLLSLDEYHHLQKTGRFVLIEDCEIVAGGMIGMKELPNQRDNLQNILNLTTVQHHITTKRREEHNGHRGGVLWFTGLPGSGKSTLAMKLEQLLFSKGYQVYVLDGDNMRSRINSSLGFSPPDRAENIRRTGEVSALFADAGFICITALISPYQTERDKIRQMLPQGSFHEVYIKADLESCILRDPKGLYKKAKRGEILDFTGISAPYEAPIEADLTIDTVNLSIEECLRKIEEYVKEKFSLSYNQLKEFNLSHEIETLPEVKVEP